MTDIRAAALHCECKKVAYRQTKDGVVISLLIHPNDVPDALATAPLGTRYMAALVELGDDEQPVNRNPGAEPDHSRAVSADSQTAPTMKGERSDSCSPKPHQADNPSPSGGGTKLAWRELPYSQQAAIRCNEPEFWQFLRERGRGVKVDNADDAAHVVRWFCHVDSRKDIRSGTPAGNRWERLDSDYQLARMGALV